VNPEPKSQVPGRAPSGGGEGERAGPAPSGGGEGEHAGPARSGGGEGEHDLRELLRRVELAGQYQRAARARQTGAHQVELAALEHLSALGGLTPGELGHRLGLTSGGVTALAGRLIEQGWVERAPHPTDKRMRILTTTDEGAAHVAQQLEPVLSPPDRLFDWLSADDTRLLARLLESVAALKEHAAAATPGPEPERTGEPYSPALLM
jgi:DNA-binding MarR family transcriptional regulator